MAFTVEFEGGTARAWELTETGATAEAIEDYTPALFVDGPEDALASLRDRLVADPKVVETGFESHHTSLHAAHTDDSSRVLRVALERLAEVRTLGHEIRGLHERGTHPPGTLRLFDVDLAPGFRFCLDRGRDPTPSRPLRTCSLDLTDRALAQGDLEALKLEGEPIDGPLFETIAARLERDDPDVLVVSHGDLVPALGEAAAEAGWEDFALGRRSGWSQLAGASTYASYGQVGHSPARYQIPGRAIVDESNSFLWHQAGLPGIEYMVGQTGRPLQEAAWGSIGTLLTSRQIRLAREEWDVLAPWNKWEPESFKDVSTLHAADRGGFTFAPEVGLHEAVHEIDFASLYPRIICEHNISPETVDCGCNRAVQSQVPELEYPICSADGFLPTVLERLLDDRAAMKRRLHEDPPEDEATRLRAESGAIKWILVSCFGYQGYRNAKFGRIECHEAINAHARAILLDSKTRLEAAGWHVVHGIVDSLWVAPAEANPAPLEAVIDAISEDVGIALEHDGTYEWVCFVPRRNATGGTVDGVTSAGPAGALTRYFGKRLDGSYKYRGIECRQHSTPPFIVEAQRAFIETLDRERDPAAVCDRLERAVGRLRRGAVDPSDLVITKRVSKPLAAYRQETHTVGALRRYAAADMDRQPGQSVSYVVVDDGASRARERVRLAFEELASYDGDFYVDQLVRACESITSPLGWDRGRLRRELADGRTVGLSAFLEG